MQILINGGMDYMKKNFEIFGWYGTVAILSAYALVSFSIISSNSIWYQMLNLTGATGIVIISFSKKVYQPAFLNLIWAIIAAVVLIKLILR